jgi:hypothetical protein
VQRAMNLGERSSPSTRSDRHRGLRVVGGQTRVGLAAGEL